MAKKIEYHKSESVIPKVEGIENSKDFIKSEGNWWWKQFGIGDKSVRQGKSKSQHNELQTLSKSIVCSISFGKRNNKMAIASGPRVSLYDMKSENLEKAIHNVSSDSPVGCVDFREGDGRVIAHGSEKGQIHVIDVMTRSELRKFKVNSAVHVVRWLHDGKRLASGGNDGRIYIWHLEKDLGR